MTARPAQSPHVLFIGIALAIAILGGFSLAIGLPLAAAVGFPIRGWISHAQVHGHLQAIGFVGLFVVGVAYRLVPSFAGKPAVRFPWLIPVSLWLIVTGVLLRSVGQPAAARHEVFAFMMAASAWLECSGAACFALNIAATLRPFPRTDPGAPFLLAGALWFLVQALLGGWWVSSAAAESSTMIPPVRDGLLVTLQFFGFHLMFILGVGVRAFPVFFAMRRPSVREVMIPFLLTQGGLVAVTVAGVVEASSSVGWEPLQNLGMVALGVGIVWVAARTGWWRPPTRIRATSRSFALTLQMALAWLTLAGVLVAMGALRAIAWGTLPPWAEVDAVRHIIAVGVVLTTMVAMAQLILPEFASERFAGRQGAWRGVVLGGLLSIATILRAGSRLLTDTFSPDIVHWAMAASGIIALAVTVTFAALFIRGVRQHRLLQERFEAFATRGESWVLTPRSGPSVDSER